MPLIEEIDSSEEVTITSDKPAFGNVKKDTTVKRSLPQNFLECSGSSNDVQPNGDSLLLTSASEPRRSFLIEELEPSGDGSITEVKLPGKVTEIDSQETSYSTPTKKIFIEDVTGEVPVSTPANGGVASHNGLSSALEETQLVANGNTVAASEVIAATDADDEEDDSKWPTM